MIELHDTMKIRRGDDLVNESRVAEYEDNFGAITVTLVPLHPGPKKPDDVIEAQLQRYRDELYSPTNNREVVLPSDYMPPALAVKGDVLVDKDGTRYEVLGVTRFLLEPPYMKCLIKAL